LVIIACFHSTLIEVGRALTPDIGSADGTEPLGAFGEHLVGSLGKLKGAVTQQLLQGVPGSLLQTAGDLTLAGWNLVEIAPDAVIGNLSAGAQLTTTVFDNGQVLVDCLTDILPGGEAWLRVHAGDVHEGRLPLLYNLQMPEKRPVDVRWRHVRNTPFRKTIETPGTLLGDVLTLTILGETPWLSSKPSDGNRQNS
jgi:hypothetical protein